MKKVKRSLISLLLVTVMLVSCLGQVFSVFAAECADAERQAAELEALVKEAVRDGDEAAKEYPKGLFNFLLTQFVINESDGFGEGLEQQEFVIDDGEGYLSFRNSGSDYFVKNETEFRQYLNNQTMGGLQL